MNYKLTEKERKLLEFLNTDEPIYTMNGLAKKLGMDRRCLLRARDHLKQLGMFEGRKL